MLPYIAAARHDGGYRVWHRLSDGAKGTVDLESELNGRLFEPLRKVSLFSKVRLDPELRTLVWPNGADIAPEFLRELLDGNLNP